jgi:hypothetical protein
MRNVVLGAVPAATVALAAFGAAWPAYAILRRAKPGRARSAIAYLLGFFAGLGVTAAMSMLAGDAALDPAAIVTGGTLAAFIGPFIGLVHAKLRGPARRRVRRFDPDARQLAARQF